MKSRREKAAEEQAMEVSTPIDGGNRIEKRRRNGGLKGRRDDIITRDHPREEKGGAGEEDRAAGSSGGGSSSEYPTSGLGEEGVTVEGRGDIGSVGAESFRERTARGSGWGVVGEKDTVDLALRALSKVRVHSIASVG